MIHIQMCSILNSIATNSILQGYLSKTLKKFRPWPQIHSFHSHTWGTALLPNIPLSTAIDLPTITSSLTFSMMAAASPATRANRTGALYKFQNRNSSPRLAVVLPTWPNKLALGSQKTRSKHKTTWNTSCIFKIQMFMMFIDNSKTCKHGKESFITY